MMDTTTFSDDLRRYFFLLWRWAWLLLLATFLAASAAYIFSKRTTPVYQASTLLMVSEAPSTKALDMSSLQASERLASTYAQTMTTRSVLQGIINRLGLQVDVKDLKEAIDVQPVRDTQLLQVTVEDTSPVQAAQIANTLVEEFILQIKAEQASRYAESKQSLEQQLNQLDEQIQSTTDDLNALSPGAAQQAERDRLQANLAQYRQTYATLLQSYEQVRLAEAQSTASVIQKEPAVPPEIPVRPRVLRNTALAAVVGLMLAVGLVFLIEALDDTIKDPDEITRQLGVPILGLIAHHDQANGHLITSAQPRAPVSEAFRSVRTNLQYSSVDRPLRTLLVTSPTPGDGKTIVAANLAVVMAQSDRNVVLMDADLRRPKVHRFLDVENRAGVSGLFIRPRPAVEGKLHLNGSLQSTPVPNLQVMTSGSLPPNPAELLGSEKMNAILEGVLERADVVVMDSPPLLAVTDAAVLATRVDGVLLVVKPGMTKMDACRQAVEQLRRVGANLLGIVLNDVELKNSRINYYYYKGYYTSYAYGQHGKPSSGLFKSKKRKARTGAPRR